VIYAENMLAPSIQEVLGEKLAIKRAK